MPHDSYLDAIGIANETTVPLLLHRLREDHGASEPPPLVDPRTGSTLIRGFSCVHVHLIDALRDITNTDQGMYFPRWHAWWTANQHRTRRQWMLAGFAEAGFQPSDPVDERFGLELIEAIAAREAYRAANARRLLIDVPPELRRQWIAVAGTFERPQRRRGAALALEGLSPRDE